MIYVMQRLLAFLDFYYLHNGYGNKEIQKLTDFYRYCIAFSYLVIDLIYPVSFVMLYLFYQTGSLVQFIKLTLLFLNTELTDTRIFYKNKTFQNRDP